LEGSCRLADFNLDDMALLRDTVMTIYSTGFVPEKVKK
jgi:hypothetical protein